MEREDAAAALSAYASSIQTVDQLTQASSIDLPNRPPLYIRRADISASLQAYERLLSATKAYTTTMLAMSKASSELAEALEDCSRIKGAHAKGPMFQAACGLHYLKSNYEQVLCDTFWKEFSIPLLSQLDLYRTNVRERQLAHESEMAQQSRVLKDIETKYQREGRKKRRDLNSFRTMLTELQAKVNEMENTKAQHYTDVLEHEDQTWAFLASKVMLLVRAQVDMADRLSTKAVTDPVLESMMASIPDPFGSYGPAKREGELFTILQPAHAPDALGASPAAGLSRPDSGTEAETPESHPHDEDRALFPWPSSAEQEEGTPPIHDTLRTHLLPSQPSYQSLFGYAHAESPRDKEDKDDDDDDGTVPTSTPP
ncbi:hypothetical protein MNAN1_003223 [Malassezia nana]|uniref:Protein IVY1 n=1 Tax=Malassezia nana TaxID=180528 RepID=A0AAF0ETQ0_9BASI|nr:hypothetical protein MNAN1_003223 [Malassezia nana]